ncbi:MAG: LTA synthase family protein [Leptospiraceae bacterium]|nr:LTA synthase family protein [Leptospiraceae bacterium]
MKRLQNTAWKQRILLLLTAFFILVAGRVFFLVYNYPKSPPAPADIALAFVRGIPFDLATIPVFLLPGMLVGLGLLLFFWVLQKMRKKETLAGLSTATWAFRIELAVHLAFFAFLIGLMLSSAYNYRFNDRHLGWEFSAYLVDLPMLARSSIERSPVFSVGLLALVGLFVALAIWIPQRLKQTFQVGKEILHLLLWAILLLVLSRGGFQASPIRPADALRTGNSYLDQLSLNGVFTVSRDLSDEEEFRPVVDRQEAVRYSRALIDRSDAFLSDEFPLLRYMPPGKSAMLERSVGTVKKPNIVLLILESGGASLLKHHGGDPRLTPFLNDLLFQSVYFERFFASGGRSANGIFAMFTGIPDRAGRTILRSSQIQNRFGGLATLLAQNGYHTSFYHGGDATFDNLNRVLPKLGFQIVRGQEALKNLTDEAPSSTIGFDDRQVLRLFLKHLNEQEGPFFASYFSQSTHHPFSIPADFASRLASDARTKDMKGFPASVRFMDESLKEFFESARKEPWFKNTIFLVVADHTQHAGLNYLQDRQIPLFIYAPDLLQPQIRSDIASQLDLLPTILALSGGGSVYCSMGRDLTSQFYGNNGKPFAFFAGGSDTDIIGWIEGDRILFKHFFLEPGILVPSVEPLSGKNLMTDEPDLYSEYLKNARIYYQMARTLEKENSIWPDSDGLEKIYRHAKKR